MISWSLRVSLRSSMLKRTFDLISMLIFSQHHQIDHSNISSNSLSYLIEIVYFSLSMLDLMNSISLDHFLMINFLMTIDFLTLFMEISFLITMNNEIIVNRITRTAAMSLMNFISIFHQISSCLYLISLYK